MNTRLVQAAKEAWVLIKEQLDNMDDDDAENVMEELKNAIDTLPSHTPIGKFKKVIKLLPAVECPHCHAINEKLPDEDWEVLNGNHGMRCDNCRVWIWIGVTFLDDRPEVLP